jgi:hypothetical protein
LHIPVRLHKEKHMHLPFLAFLAAASGACAQASSVPISSVHDGRWSVALVCPDLKNQSSLIKGYEYTFAAVVKDGKLEAQYGTPGQPDSLSLAGIVRSDGALEITANGIVGASTSAVGMVPRGTPYHYTMRGHLGGTGGQAVRREARACTATFSRQ